MANYHALGEPSDKVLRVCNLPEGISEAAIRNIFQLYGSVQNVQYIRKDRWALVTYSTYKEAETAFVSLNNQKPLNLKIAFNKKSLMEQVGPFQHSNDLSVVDPRYSHPPMMMMRQCVGRGSGMIGPQVPRAFPVYSYHVNDDLLYGPPVDHRVLNPYEVGAHPDADYIYTRGTVYITQDGRRRVSMGRGYTYYDIPTPQSHIRDQMKIVHETRNPGVYEFDNGSKMSSVIGCCAVCAEATTSCCSNCQTRYCSLNCQKQDWPKHMFECNVPKLIQTTQDKDIGAASFQNEERAGLRRPQVATTNNLTKDVEAPIARAPEKTLRRPRVAMGDSVNVSQKIIEFVEAEKKSLVNGDLTPELQKCTITEPAFEPTSNHTETVKRVDKEPAVASSPAQSLRDEVTKQAPAPQVTIEKPQEVAKPPEELPKPPVTVSNETTSPVVPANEAAVSHPSKVFPMARKACLNATEEFMNFKRDGFLPSDIFTSVVCSWLEEDGSIWVRKSDSAKSFLEMQEQLQEQILRCAVSSDATVGNTYAACYEGLWCRILIKSKNPTIGLYIDYGNSETLEPNQEIRELPSSIAGIPQYVHRIALTPEDSEKYCELTDEHELSVKPIEELEGGVTLVRVKEETQEEEEVVEVEIPVQKIPEPVEPLQRMTSATQSTQSLPQAPIIASQRAPSIAGTSQKSEKSVDMGSEIVAKVQNFPTVIRYLERNSTGRLLMTFNLGNDNYSALLTIEGKQEEALQKILDDIPNKCKHEPNFQVSVGDFIWGHREEPEDTWVRGCVVSTGPPHKIAIIDEGKMAVVTEICPIAKEDMGLVAFGVQLNIPNSGKVIDDCIANADALEYFVSAYEDWKTTVKGQPVVNVTLRPEGLPKMPATMTTWAPTAEQRGVPSAILKSPCKVQITAFKNHTMIYLRRAEPDKMERFNRIVQDIATWTQTAPQVTRLPQIGEIVCAKYVDGNYYRAVVTSVENDEMYVMYLDYGNQESAKLSDMKVISDELKNEPSSVVKVSLVGVPKDTPLSQPVAEYLDSLILDETVLTCTYEGDFSESDVTLKLNVNETVNDKVSEMLKPAAEKPLGNKVFMLDDMSLVSLGEMGSTVKGVLLHVLEAGRQLVFCPEDRSLIDFVNEQLCVKLNEYCATIEDPYVPRKGELCLALYEGSYYRAACVRPTSTPGKSQVMFVDYGNMEDVDIKNIKAMHKDFMTPDALASICIVDGIFEDNNKVKDQRVVKRLEELIPQGASTTIKIKDNDGRGYYSIELPEIQQQLVTEGLIS